MLNPIFSILASALLWIAATDTIASPPLTGTVVHITDGRMFTLDVQGRRQKIVLAGVEIPGRDDLHGAQARRLLASLVFNRHARVMEVGRDARGRVLGRVHTGELDVNAAMVERGYARIRHNAPADPDLIRLETQARLARRGIWSDSFAARPTPSPVVCTMDVKRCPDGSWVSRRPPDCRFAPCPGGK